MFSCTFPRRKDGYLKSDPTARSIRAEDAGGPRRTTEPQRGDDGRYRVLRRVRGMAGPAHTGGDGPKAAAH